MTYEFDFIWGKLSYDQKKIHHQHKKNIFKPLGIFSLKNNFLQTGRFVAKHESANAPGPAGAWANSGQMDKYCIPYIYNIYKYVVNFDT